jgi:hypothetical protein
MATLYLDFENGNDNYGGTSFSLLAQGTDGRITSTTFSSATASFPNDGSLIGQYLSIFNGTIYAVYNITAWVSSTSLTIAALSGGTALANQTVDRQYYIGGRWKNITTGATAVRIVQGDTIRIMGSPEPTSLGINGTWTSQALQATRNISSATATTPITITTTVAHGYSTGDTVVASGATLNTAANGTWEITVTGPTTFTLNGSSGTTAGGTSGTVRLRSNTRVMLASAVTQNIASTGPRTAAWTARPNVTTSLNATTKEHRDSDNIAIGAGFNTGLAAYWPTGTLDLSGYQQVSFWIQQSAGVVGAAGAVDLRLCSDNAGTTAVNTINIPNLVVTGRWMPVTVDLGTSLGNSIQSIALYVNTDNGAQTFLLSNIIACKASSDPDSLTLTSLIGKNTPGETFWGIQSINGTRVMLDADTNATPTSTSVRGYYGTSETVTTWKRETIKLGPAATSTTDVQTIIENGMTFSGGWDRTAMTTQNSETWLDGVNGLGRLLKTHADNYGVGLILDKLAFVRCNTALVLWSSASNLSIIHIGNSTNILAAAPIASNTTLNIDFMVANTSLSSLSAGSGIKLIVDKVLSNDTGLTCTPIVSLIEGKNLNSLIANTTTNAFSGQPMMIANLISRDNTTFLTHVATNAATPYNTILENCQIEDTTEISAWAYYQTGGVFSQNHDRVANNHKIFLGGALISSATDQRKSPSGISWKIQPTNTLRAAGYPVTLTLAKVACAANSLVTIKAWMRRDNTGLTMRLVCKGGQIAGVTSDVVSSMTAAANTWEELTITFTPTEVGVVEITAEAWGGTTFSGWVDDMTISQA